jgi:hypothetical protein
MLPTEQMEAFGRDGFLVVNDFLKPEETQGLLDEIGNIIDDRSFVEDLKNMKPDERLVNTGTEYFLDSCSMIRGFIEPKAKIEDYSERNKLIYHKIGHSLHTLNPVFKAATYNERTEAICKSFGYIKPTVCQGMIIFKQPFIGEGLSTHHDATYLYVDPVKMVGFWIPLQDATIENCCLEFVPGSHKYADLSRRFIRNPNKEEFNAGKRLIFKGDPPTPDESEYVPVEVKAGSLLLIHGEVLHRSKVNLSPKSRNVYTFHVFDAGVSKWSNENWIPENPISFKPLYDQTAA